MINDPVLAVAVRAVRRAGSVIIDAARDLKRMPSHARDHGSIATTATADAASAIVATLRAAFPTHTILGDEAADAPGAAQTGYRWVVNALDGATNFVHGLPHHATSIALTHGNDITHAVVHHAVHDELYMAIRGKGAQLNGSPIHVSTCASLERALVGTVFPGRASPRMAAYLPVFNALLPRCGSIRRAGACALDLAYVAAGRLDGFWVMSLKARDIAAGTLLVREAGGRVGDFAGGNDYLRTNEVIAAAPGIFSPLREAIAGAAAAR